VIVSPRSKRRPAVGGTFRTRCSAGSAEAVGARARCSDATTTLLRAASARSNAGTTRSWSTKPAWDPCASRAAIRTWYRPGFTSSLAVARTPCLITASRVAGRNLRSRLRWSEAAILPPRSTATIDTSTRP
jgi:hypothetical protein